MNEHLRLVQSVLAELGASPDLIAQRGLPVFPDAMELALAHTSLSGREHFLVPAAATAWQAMRDTAAEAGVVLVMISGFRSFDHQLRLIRDKLDAGQSVEKVLQLLAPPGCSEHHTGRAADIGTPGCPPLSEDFECTSAFSWLSAHAASFGFRMTYPRDNPWGYLYEPWHWCFANA
jgi:D-alanyl-D-alanine carboxypeptidase